MDRENWFGQPKETFVYLFQVILLYIVIITCIINLSIGNCNSELWTALLSSCLGYMLPNPSMRKNIRDKEENSFDTIDGSE